MVCHLPGRHCRAQCTEKLWERGALPSTMVTLGHTPHSAALGKHTEPTLSLTAPHVPGKFTSLRHEAVALRAKSHDLGGPSLGTRPAHGHSLGQDLSMVTQWGRTCPWSLNGDEIFLWSFTGDRTSPWPLTGTEPAVVTHWDRTCCGHSLGGHLCSFFMRKLLFTKCVNPDLGQTAQVPHRKASNTQSSFC